MSKTFEDIADAQGWNADSRATVMHSFIVSHPDGGDLVAYAQSRADEENGVYPLPDFQKDVRGQCYGGAFWSEEEYRIRIVAVTPGDRYQMTVELADGSKVGETIISDEEADGIIRMGSTDHSLSGYADDWKIPVGIERTIEWTLQTDINHTVRLDATDIDEIAAWFGFALGFEEWTGGEDWEY